MIQISLKLNLPSLSFEMDAVVPVYFKNRINIIGTCALRQSEGGIIGAFTVAEELLDSIFVFYIYGSINENVVLEGILLDDTNHNKNIDKVGTLKME